MTDPQHPLPSGYGAQTTAEQVMAHICWRDRVVVVTGGHAGLGLETTRVLVHRMFYSMARTKSGLNLHVQFMACLMGSLMAAGCAAPLRASADVFADMAQTVHERSGQTPLWRRSMQSDPQTRDKVQALEASWRRAQHAVAQDRVKVLSEVRQAERSLLAARSVIEPYTALLVPLRRKITELTVQQLNMARQGAWDVVLARQNELQAQCERVKAMQAY